MIGAAAGSAVWSVFAAFRSPLTSALPYASTSADKCVADTVHGAEVDGLRRIYLQLLPQLQNLVVHRSRGGIRGVAPDIVQQLFACNHSLGVIDKVSEQFDLVRSEDNRDSFLEELHRGEVRGDIAECNLIASVGSGLLCAADGGLDPRRQFARAERLGDVIIRAKLQQQHLIGHLGDSAQPHDRRVRRPRLDPFADLPPRQPRQHQVKHYARWPQRLARRQTLNPVARYMDRIALRCELAVQRLLYAGIVLYYENCAHLYLPNSGSCPL